MRRGTLKPPLPPAREPEFVEPPALFFFFFKIGVQARIRERGTSLSDEELARPFRVKTTQRNHEVRDVRHLGLGRLRVRFRCPFRSPEEPRCIVERIQHKHDGRGAVEVATDASPASYGERERGGGLRGKEGWERWLGKRWWDVLVVVVGVALVRSNIWR